MTYATTLKVTEQHQQQQHQHRHQLAIIIATHCATELRLPKSALMVSLSFWFGSAFRFYTAESPTRSYLHTAIAAPASIARGFDFGRADP